MNSSRLVRARSALIAGLFLPALCLTAAPGCAWISARQRATAGANLPASAQRMQETRSRTNLTLGSLNRLVSDPSSRISEKFAAFEESMRMLDALAQEVEALVTDMETQKWIFLWEWDQQLAAMQHEDMSARSEQRTNEVHSMLDKLHGDYQVTRAALEPFMRELHSIQESLQLDLTPAGVRAVRTSVAEVDTSSARVLGAIDALIADFRTLGVEMAP